MRIHRPTKKKRKKKPKSAYELGRHTLKTAWRRYQIVLDQEARQKIVKQIQNGKAQFIEQWSTHRTIWRVNAENRTICVVYDRRYKELATVLHPNDARTKVTNAKLK